MRHIVLVFMLLLPTLLVGQKGSKKFSNYFKFDSSMFKLVEYLKMPANYVDQLKELEDDLRVKMKTAKSINLELDDCLLYTSPSPRDKRQSRMPSSA